MVLYKYMWRTTSTTPVNPIYTPELNSLFSVLEDPVNCEEQYLDLRGKSMGALEAYVKSAGSSLLNCAIDLVLNGTPAQRKRAMLLLAQYDKIPDYALQRLRQSCKPQIWAYWHILSYGSQDDLDKILSLQPQDVHASMSPYVKPIPDDAQEQIGRHLSSIWGVEQEIAEQDDICRSISHKFLFDFSQAFYADQLALLANDSSYMDLDNNSLCEIFFIAVFSKLNKREGWRLQSYELLESGEVITDVLVGDFDSDETIAEFCIRSRILGGSGGTGVIRMYDSWEPVIPHRLSSSKPDFRVCILEKDNIVYFITSDYYLQAHTGTTALEGFGVMAWEKTVYQWGFTFYEVAELYTPLR